MLKRQRGALSLVWVAVVSGLLALLAMAALFSMRYERNLFAEAWAKVAGGGVAQQVVDVARQASGAGSAQVVLRKCLINGKTVVSNTDCTNDNKTSKAMDLHDSHGIESPKPPPAPKQAEPGSDPMLDKMIEKQVR
jgi:type II secretory pathway pseudopilin PulG